MKILIAVDGSEPALDAVHHALRRLQSGLRARFLLATAQEPVYLYERVLPPDAEVLDRVTSAVGGRALAGAEASLNASGVPCERGASVRPP
jgi:nucleotide-binding universal stress UspA family protein